VIAVLSIRRTGASGDQCRRHLKVVIIALNGTVLAVAASRSCSVGVATSTITTASGRRMRGIGIVASIDTAILTAAAHLMPQEGDNGGDHYSAHQERRSECGQHAHRATVQSRMNTTISMAAAKRARRLLTSITRVLAMGAEPM
jgi:hypothetical protein